MTLGASAEVLSPDGIADDDHGWCASPVVARVECPTQRRMRAEHVEQRWGAHHERQHSGSRCAGVRRVRSGIGGEDRHLVENAEAFAKKVVLFVGPLVVHPEDLNATRVSVGQAANHETADDADQRHARANPEPECHEHDRGEPGATVQLSQRVARVGNQFLEQRDAPAFARPLGLRCECAEIPSCFPLCLRCRQSTFAQRHDIHRAMKLELFVQLSIGSVPVEQCASTKHEVVKPAPHVSDPQRVDRMSATPPDKRFQAFVSATSRRRPAMVGR